MDAVALEDEKICLMSAAPVAHVIICLHDPIDAEVTIKSNDLQAPYYNWGLITCSAFS